MANTIDFLCSFVEHSERYYTSSMYGEAWKRKRGKPDSKNIMRNISQQYYLQIAYYACINASVCIKGKLNTVSP